MDLDLSTVFNENDLADLRDVLGLAEGDDLDAAIAKVTVSALHEYREMLLAGGMPSRAPEIQEHRLFHLITHYYGGRIPPESEIANLFHETMSRSRGMLRNVLTRYARELEESLHGTLQELLMTAQRQGDQGPWRLVIQSDNSLEQLNHVIATRAPQLDPVRKVPNSARTYRIDADSFNVLCQHFGIEQPQ